MIEHDNLQRFIFDNAPVRGEYIHLGESFQTIAGQHDYPPAVRQLLGEALCVAGLLTAIIKFKGRLTVQFRGKGKLKLLLAQCNNNFNVRGLVKCDDDLTYQDLMEAFNDGVLVIMLDGGSTKRNYQGVVSWRGNSLVESIEGYFRDSEQLATKLWLSVNKNEAAGLLLQVLPGIEKSPHGLEQDIVSLHWERLTAVTSAVSPDDMLNMSYENLLRKLYPKEEVRIFAPQEITFRCTCSRKRGEEAIGLLGVEEAEAELKDKQVIVVTCDFCNKEYVFDKVDVAAVFAKKGSSETHLH